MIWAEWWAWEINLFFAGLLCTSSSNLTVTNVTATAISDASQIEMQASCVPLDVFPVLSQTMVLAFMLHFGFSLQGGAHVGNMLGGNQPKRARLSSVVSYPKQVIEIKRCT